MPGGKEAIDLLPCPFCDRELTQTSPGWWEHPGSAYDGTCLLAGYRTQGWRAWNRRPPHPDPDTSARVLALVEQAKLWLADYDDGRSLDDDHAARFRELIAAFKEEPDRG